MKKTFISGLAVVVPFALTGWALISIFGSIDAWINYYLNLWFNFTFPGLGLTLLVVVTLVSGIIVQTGLGKYFYNLINKVIFQIPLVNKVYKVIKEIVDTITAKQSFKTVVKVEFPKQGVYSLGFLTNEDTVFIPTAPNPTSGFLIKTNKYEILDMEVEAAIKYVVSMGTIINKDI